LGFLILVGIIDYLSGYELFFSVFYLLGIGLATWYMGRGYGLCLSVLSVAVWITGDLAAGARYSSSFIPIWNSTILLTFYFIVVWLLASLQSLHKGLEEQVRQRTLALTQEMAERERLEKEILEVSEREQRRIGRDLHDGLCQHLTGTALAGQVLRERLEAKSAPEAADAACGSGARVGVAVVDDPWPGTDGTKFSAPILPPLLRSWSFLAQPHFFTIYFFHALCLLCGYASGFNGVATHQSPEQPASCATADR
jgi:low affinity Fe/Cu permease